MGSCVYNGKLHLIGGYNGAEATKNHYSVDLKSILHHCDVFTLTFSQIDYLIRKWIVIGFAFSKRKLVWLKTTSLIVAKYTDLLI